MAQPTLGAFWQPLESWLPLLGVLPGVDPYLCAVTSFARSLRHGVTNLMVHYKRVQGGMPYVDEAMAVARAARDVGVHIGFAVAMRDRNGIGLGDDATMLAALRPALREPVQQRLTVRPLPPAEHLAVVDTLARALAGDPGLARHVTLQYGPAGVQWCSTPLLESIAAASHDSGRPVHMHLLENRYQREWADQAYPQGIVRNLHDIGRRWPRNWARSTRAAAGRVAADQGAGGARASAACFSANRQAASCLPGPGAVLACAFQQRRRQRAAGQPGALDATPAQEVPADAQMLRIVPPTTICRPLDL